MEIFVFNSVVLTNTRLKISGIATSFHIGGVVKLRLKKIISQIKLLFNWPLESLSPAPIGMN